MGKLDVHIRHGGGGDSTVIWVVLALVAVVLVAGSAAAVTSFITTLLIVLASVMGGGFVLGLVAWFLTRDWRARRAQEVEDFRQAKAEAYHQHQLDMVRAKAQIKAQENATMAMMVAQAIQSGQQQPQAWPPDVGYQPKVYKAEVIRRKDDK